MAKIKLSQISAAAPEVAEYAGRDLDNEILLGYEIVALTPVHGESAKAFEPQDLFELTTAHWFLVKDHISEDPEIISRRLMRWTLTVEEILNYKPEYCHGGILDPEGDFELLEWDERVAVSSGQVPDDVVDALCRHLEENCSEHLAEEAYADAYYKGKALPPWDPRIVKIVEAACLRFGDVET